jgi:hypothetical protein
MLIELANRAKELNGQVIFWNMDIEKKEKELEAFSAQGLTAIYTRQQLQDSKDELEYYQNQLNAVDVLLETYGLQRTNKL